MQEQVFVSGRCFITFPSAEWSASVHYNYVSTTFSYCSLVFVGSVWQKRFIDRFDFRKSMANQEIVG